MAPVNVAVGGTYSWTPNVLAFGYNSSKGDSGSSTSVRSGPSLAVNRRPHRTDVEIRELKCGFRGPQIVNVCAVGFAARDGGVIIE